MIVSKNGKGGEEIATTLTTAKEQPLPRKEKAAASIRFGSGWDTCVLPDHRRIEASCSILSGTIGYLTPPSSAAPGIAARYKSTGYGRYKPGHLSGAR